MNVLVFSELFTLFEAVVDPPGHKTQLKLLPNTSFKDQKSFGCGWFFKKRIETAGKYSFRNSKVICPAGPEKVRSVVEVRHPGRLGNHLLEQLPAGSRHLSPLLLQKSSLGSLAAVSY